MKLIITAPNSINEVAWGLVFVDGVAETTNNILAQKLKQKGYKVEQQKVEKDKKATSK